MAPTLVASRLRDAIITSSLNRRDNSADDNIRIRNDVIIAFAVVIGVSVISVLTYLHFRNKRRDKAEVESDTFNRADYGLDEMPAGSNGKNNSGGKKKMKDFIPGAGGSSTNGGSSNGTNTPTQGQLGARSLQQQRLSQQQLAQAENPFADDGAPTKKLGFTDVVAKS